MTTHKDKILLKITDLRVLVSRLFAIVIVFLLFFTGHSFAQESVPDLLFEVVGLFLLSVCSIGRLWALMYISGNKRQELITDGPYSIVRHPLYFFSLIGALGIGFGSENILVLALLIIFYLFYYPLTILVEERKLTDQFGQAYLDYMERTPRFLPKLSLYKAPAIYPVKTRSLVWNLADGMWFVWIFILMHAIETLQDSGLLPVILRVP